MVTTDNTIEVLNDLIEINNDRIVGYEKSLEELNENDANLKSYFLKYIDQSRQLKLALGTEVQALRGTMESGTTTSGKLYRAWMDIKAAFSGRDEKTVLDSAEYGEDAAQKAYASALEDDLPQYIRDLVESQRQELKQAHDEVKALRDQQSR
ncbi:PA2169 family four-helix-bundle protein [Chitinophaga agrisoli]|uniref:PA2169 family four-helix-bundle protein n=1 Tax=Chitinophaga agrisoli TaxID=2607653 RepID=A0A5B2VJS6_9BACT|nr:PA2169 family four-helix-bundle protein [Chitinophaga agrisoli]KAA2239351.1 PA2169 family four-helix-bundle protein [Chitinophaga agrisoli]